MLVTKLTKTVNIFQFLPKHFVSNISFLFLFYFISVEQFILNENFFEISRTTKMRKINFTFRISFEPNFDQRISHLYDSYQIHSILGQSPICTDIDECALEIHDCQQGTVCHNLSGFYRCIEEFRTVSQNQT